MTKRQNPPILGYLRPDGRLGIRNYVAVIYTTHCSMAVAQRLLRLYPAGALLFGYPGGCALRENPFRKICELGKHSQFGAALVVGLGCEGTDAYMVAEEIAKSGKPAEAIKVNEVGGDLKAIEAGSRILARLLQHVSLAERATVAPSDLIVAMLNGASDATSGLASNPITGVAGDLLVDAGGTYITGSLSELMGCEEVMAARAVNDRVAQEIRAAIKKAEAESFAAGRFSWGYGNILGGLTTIEEKSYGCIAKSGTKPILGILKDFGLPPSKGCWLQESPPETGFFHGDPEGINQFAACGAHIGLFTTGCGSTTGGLIPVIKVMANPHRQQLMLDNVDFDATPILSEAKTVEQMGEELYDLILAVAAGKLTRSEVHQHYEA